MEGVGGRKFFAREPFAEPSRKAAGRSDFLSSRISHKMSSSAVINILKDCMIKITKLIRSFRHAFDGIFSVMLTEQNFRVMITLVILVLIVGVWLPLKFWQWTALVIASVLMLVVELINTAIEKAMDLVLPASLEEIKVIKHIMAGAALVASVGWLVVVVLIVLSIFALQ